MTPVIPMLLRLRLLSGTEAGWACREEAGMPIANQDVKFQQNTNSYWLCSRLPAHPGISETISSAKEMLVPSCLDVPKEPSRRMRRRITAAEHQLRVSGAVSRNQFNSATVVREAVPGVVPKDRCRKVTR